MAITLTCDGPPVNIAMLRALGATVESDKIIDSQLGLETEYPAYAVEDICHMVKLIRNSWGAFKKIKNLQGQVIDWTYVARLHELQDSEQLHLGNKLTLAHINWQDQKMKTRLAVQTISHRNATAIDFARNVLKLPQFKNSEATTEFMRMIDSAFDVMNSKSKFGLGLKAAMSLENEAEWRDVFLTVSQYLSTLTDMNGIPIIETSKKTGFLGFIVGMNTFSSLFDVYVKTGVIDYLTTFKFSQDHLEQTFAAYRGSLGCNTNPAPTQFKATFRKLMVGGTSRVYSRSNALQEDGTVLLDIFRSNKEIQKYVENTFEVEDEFETFEAEEECTMEYRNCVVEYISGFALKKVLKKDNCSTCEEDLTEKTKSDKLQLVHFKDTKQDSKDAGLIYPSQECVKACLLAERHIREMRKQEGFLTTSKLLVKIRVKTMTTIVTQYPALLKSNRCSCSQYEVFKNIVSVYINLRLKYISKCLNEDVKIRRKRSKLTKLICFSHQ